MAVQVFQPEKYRNFSGVADGSVGIHNVISSFAAAVAQFDTGGTGNDRIITVVIVPVRHVGYTGTQAALVQSVCILFSVYGRLNMTGAEDDTEQVFRYRFSDIPVCVPTFATFTGVSGIIAVSNGSRNLSQLATVGSVPVGLIAAAPVLRRFVDNGTKFQVRAVNHAATNGCRSAFRNTVTFFSFYRFSANRFVQVVTFFPTGVIVFIPTPHILTVGTVQLRRASVLELIVVRRIKFAPDTVVGHQVTAQT